ncbi:MAG: hydrogenase nickel incorporation protein HypB [Actinobacteria bacterium]|nr:hydrogenase nickel incorporation protein HypB [Actinomycetota bacterium]
MEIDILEGVYDANERLAAENEKLFAAKQVFVINIMASPGAGKTSTIMNTVRALQDEFSIGVIEGDIASKVDAEKMKECGIPVIQINTGGACHLDANMISGALAHLDLDALDVVIIENVGNLVCPAEFRLGESLKVMLLSVAEGHDKPLKYPLMFGLADVLLVNKIDMLELTDFDMEALHTTVSSMNPNITIFELSCRTGEGFPAWVDWLKARIEASRG